MRFLLTDNNIDCATILVIGHSKLKNLVTHGITDKAPYLSKAITLHLLFLPRPI